MRQGLSECKGGVGIGFPLPLIKYPSPSFPLVTHIQPLLAPPPHHPPQSTQKRGCCSPPQPPQTLHKPHLTNESRKILLRNQAILAILKVRFVELSAIHFYKKNNLSR